MPESYSTVFHKVDESFSEEDISQYGLAIVAGDTDFVYCINDLKRGKYLGLHHMVLHNNQPAARDSQEKFSYDDFLAELMVEIPYLNEQFKILKIAYEGVRATLIPSAVYDPSEAATYLEFSFGRNSESRIFSDHLVSPDAYQVFAMPEFYAGVLTDRFSTRKIVSSTSVFIESIWLNYKSRSPAAKVFMNVRARYIDIMIFDGIRMAYFNIFSQKCQEDITYYLIFVLEQMNLDPEHTPLVLFGDTGQYEGLTDLLNIYIRHVDFGKRSTFFKYSYSLNDIPVHAHYTLLNLLSCGL